MQPITIQIVDANTVLPVRQQVLWPNHPMAFCRIDEDAQGIHYAALIADEPVCVASIYDQAGQYQLRKFATLAQFQGRGIGREVLSRIIEDLEQTNRCALWCDARKTAIRFYQKLGFTVNSDVFNKHGLEYVKMSRQLQA